MVDNQIARLPHTESDDQIRLKVYEAIYGHASLRSYLPKNSLAFKQGGNDTGKELTVGLSGKSFPRGPHPIQILVRNGNVALIGMVNSASHRQIADRQAKSVAGVSTVETYLKTARR
jgi:hypothetical protein